MKELKDLKNQNLDELQIKEGIKNYGIEEANYCRAQEADYGSILLYAAHTALS